MELRAFLSALRRSWWLAVGGLLVGASAGLALSALKTPVYVAHTQLFVSATEPASTSEAYQGSQFSQQRAASYARLLRGEELAGRLIERLELPLSAGELTSFIDAAVVPETVLLEIAVTDTSPERAQRIAGAIGDEFPDLVSELETPAGGGVSPVKVTVTERPGLPESPSSPIPERNVALGGLLGLVLGIGLAVARDRLDRSVTSPEEAGELAGVPVIGTVIQDEALSSRHVIDPKSRAAEDYRQLRTNLQFLNVDAPPKIIMVSSAMPAEGKTTAAINLALALAEAGREVVLVDADLRRPRVTNYLGMVGGVGLTNVLAGTAEAAEVMQPYAGTGLMVIGSGPKPPNPSELLTSKQMSGIIGELREKFEFVLVDAPPLLPVADATGLAVMADGVLLSVRYGRSRKDQLRQAADMLQRVGARTLGLILNIVPLKSDAAGAYGYGYSYGEDGKHRR